ncbi:bifunctional homocysteine S-methyltransferase/methylenetetrahydrofolate reductase [Granulicella cerasi]|uniref:Bifunctional homocysteine S-methyltransferase/methylenetetrahydrofolate reductase n=1 Tax=Granulicella cerasi TaxID=741063 RepID=A0ABW1ZD07_9BACT|nr:bifunctional homocysteine S-methyltransferase/methylenetetrahydrofolate reductase [Granulicella cerasi]
MADVRQKLFNGQTVLCDGAMGTMLYGCGVFINRCYDELNVSQPETVRSVHQQYLQAGAQVIETNTFGANRFRLKHFDLQEKVRAFNLAGAQLARQCIEAAREKHNTQAFVAGAIGSLGIKLAPEGDVSPADARAAFAEQIAALAEGGVDLLIVETMMSQAEALEALAAAREVAPQLPVIVLITVNDQVKLLDGTTVADAARAFAAAGAAAVGANCSSGPQVVLEAVQQMRAAVEIPIAAMPNAGLPREIEGRNIYLTSPEYMGSFARKAIRAGASWVGGCCGTTPAHVRAMRSAIRAMDAQAAGEAGDTPIATIIDESKAVAAIPFAERSTLSRKIAEGKFATLVEIVPPKGFDASKEIAGARLLKDHGVDAINIPDSPRASARMSAMSLCTQVQQQVGIETVIHYTCRDRNVLAIQSDLLGAAAIGLKNILCLTGDPPKMGAYPDATAVFDVDAIGLTRIVGNLNRGIDIGGNPIFASAGFSICVAANPGLPDMEHEVRRFAAKVEAGAEYAITQPVFDLRLLEDFLRRIEQFRIPVIAGIWPLTSYKNAEFMKNDLKVAMPEEIFQRMAATTSKEEGLAEGIKIAQEMLAAVRNDVQGVQVSAPFGKYPAAVEVLDAI